MFEGPQTCTLTVTVRMYARSYHQLSSRSAVHMSPIQGLPSVSRAIIHVDEDAKKTDGNERYKLLVEGTDLLGVISTIGWWAAANTGTFELSKYSEVSLNQTPSGAKKTLV